MKRVLIKTYSICKKIYFNLIKYQLDYSKCKRIKYKMNRLEKINSNDKILLLIPHADDELIGCYNLIKKYSNNIYLYYFSFTGENRTTDNIINRKKEFISFCERNRIKYYTDNDLNEIINSINPNYIGLPFVFDWHYEHRLISEILFKTVNVNNNIKVLQYQITTPIPSSIVNFSISFNKKEQKQKWDCFSDIYFSQKQMPIKRLKYNERINGLITKKYIAENFSISSVNNFLKLKDLMFDKDEFYEFIDRNKYNLYTIRRKVEKTFSSF